MDLIAGLPTDTLESYKKTLDTVLSLEPENITVGFLRLRRVVPDLSVYGFFVYWWNWRQ